MENNTSETHARQMGIISPQNLQTPIHIIGAGGIGSWATIALAKMGCNNIHIYDEDTIETHNTGSQVYSLKAIRKSKVWELERIILDAFGCSIHAHNQTIHQNYLKENPIQGIIILAVDNMATRKLVFEYFKTLKESWLIDGRMAANEIQLYTISPKDTAFYESTLFTDEEASPIPCTERSVIYNCLIVGGLIADLVGMIGNNRKPPLEVTTDLYNLLLFRDW